MGWGVYSEISSGVVWVRSVGVLSCVICWRVVVFFFRAWAGCLLGLPNVVINLVLCLVVFCDCTKIGFSSRTWP